MIVIIFIDITDLHLIAISNRNIIIIVFFFLILAAFFFSFLFFIFWLVALTLQFSTERNERFFDEKTWPLTRIPFLTRFFSRYLFDHTAISPLELSHIHHFVHLPLKCLFVFFFFLGRSFLIHSSPDTDQLSLSLFIYFHIHVLSHSSVAVLYFLHQSFRSWSIVFCYYFSFFFMFYISNTLTLQHTHTHSDHTLTQKPLIKNILTVHVTCSALFKRTTTTKILCGRHLAAKLFPFNKMIRFPQRKSQHFCANIWSKWTK